MIVNFGVILKRCSGKILKRHFRPLSSGRASGIETRGLKKIVFGATKASFTAVLVFFR